MIVDVVVPCFNEEDVIAVTASVLLQKLNELIKKEKVEKARGPEVHPISFAYLGQT